MLPRHVSGELAAYVDGALSPHDMQQTERHLRQCAQCRIECERVRFGMTMVRHLPSIEAPEALWSTIEATLGASRPGRSYTVRRWGLALAATVALAVLGATSWRLTQRSGVQWEVLRLDGSPSVGATPISDAGRVGAGEWIETDSASRATVTIGQIGSVEISPNSRVRVVATRPDEHRLALARGEIRATISAPPRLFFVDTPSGTAVDLGCEYVLKTDVDGFGLLQVTRGWVSFGSNGMESLVPAGASCPTRPHVGPGIPYFDDATDRMKQALSGFGFEKDGVGALNIILTESRIRDTLTLWHLLSRVSGGDRERVYDRIAQLTPVPAGVSRKNALELDPKTLERWKEELAWTW